MFVRASLYKCREENQLDATEWFIALIICSTCFGHLYAHHQELETILVFLPEEVSCSSSFPHPGRIACCTAPDRQPPATTALHTICGNNTSIVSCSWWWAYKCLKHVEQVTSAINHSVASSCFLLYAVFLCPYFRLSPCISKGNISRIVKRIFMKNSNGKSSWFFLAQYNCVENRKKILTFILNTYTHFLHPSPLICRWIFVRVKKNIST